MMRPTDTEQAAVERMVQTAFRLGCPEDQLQNFWVNGYVPQPKQFMFHAAAREADQPGGPTFIGQGGARGGAKSHAAICQVALDDCQRVEKLKCLYLRSVGKSARESFEDFLSKAIPGMMRYYQPSRSRLLFDNGSRIILGGFRNERDIDGYIGIEFDAVLVDDAQQIHPEKLKKLFGSVRTSKENWRPRKYLTFNPGEIGHAYMVKTFILPLERGQETDSRFVFSLPEDNKFLDPDYIAYLDSLTGWLYEAWRKGNFKIPAGQFFITWDEAVHVIPAFDVLPHDWPVWFSLDYGTAHPTSIYLHTKANADGMVYTIDEHWLRYGQTRDHADAMRAMLARWHIEPYRVESVVAGSDCFIRRDPSAPTIAQQYAAEGFELTPAITDRVNGAANMLHLLGDPQRNIHPTWQIFDTCTKLIECLPAMQHDPNHPEDVLKVDVTEDGYGGDDPFDSVRYGLMHAPNIGGSGWGVNPTAGYRG